MKNFLQNNELCICFILLFIGALTGQIVFGFEEHNKELTEDGCHVIDLSSYLISGHFIQSAFENWESGFLSDFVIIMLSVYLRQIGFSQIKNCRYTSYENRQIAKTII